MEGDRAHGRAAVGSERRADRAVAVRGDKADSDQTGRVDAIPVDDQRASALGGTALRYEGDRVGDRRDRQRLGRR